MPSNKSITPLTAVTVQILASLTRGPRHGYGIKLDIEERTDGSIVLGSGTLYQALQRLERAGLIAEAETAGTDGGDARRGRRYELLATGREALERELALMRLTLSSTEAVPQPAEPG